MALVVSATSFSQIVTIPDAAFKQRLLNISAINTNGDSEIQVSEAEAFDGDFYLGNSPTYTDITGIGAFINMNRVFGQTGQFLFADFSNNAGFTKIEISQSVLQEIILPTSTTNLERLQLIATQVSNLSGIDDYSNLTSINVDFTNITEIDVSNNLLLESLSLNGTDITVLDLSNNLNLRSLDITNTLLTAINFDAVNLEDLSIGFSPITSYNLNGQTNLVGLEIGEIIQSNIDLSNNVNLKNLILGGFNHSSIDVSSNSLLEDLTISSGLIDTIDISSNPLIETVRFDTSLITEINLSQQINLNWLNLYDTNIPVLDLTNNANLERLSIWISDLQSLDLSQNTNLKSINLQQTQIENVNLSGMTQLEDLELRFSPISNIVLPSNNVLEQFVLWYTEVEELDFSNFNQLCRFFVRYNSALNSVNIKNGNNVNLANGSNCGMAITGNPNLFFVCVDDANFAATNFTNVSPYITFTEDCTLSSNDINQIQGDITYDLANNNCASGNFALENILVSSSDGTNTFASTSNDIGFYTINLGENTYTTGVLGLPTYFDASPASVNDTFVGFNNTE